MGAAVLSEDGSAVLEAGTPTYKACRPFPAPCHHLEAVLKGNLAGIPAEELLKTVLSVSCRRFSAPAWATFRPSLAWQACKRG